MTKRVRFKHPTAFGVYLSPSHPNIKVQRLWNTGYDPRFGLTAGKPDYVLYVDGKAIGPVHRRLRDARAAAQKYVDRGIA